MRILEITHKARVSHIGSCLSAVDIIDAVYQIKKKKEPFVLSSGHSAVALYTILEQVGILKDPNLEYLNVHPDRNEKLGIYCSSGSLGQGLPIAVGMALANRKSRVFCLISDGECSEGSIWEALRIAYEQKLSNLRIIVNVNGFGAYDPIDKRLLLMRLEAFVRDVVEVDGHDLDVLAATLSKRILYGPLLIFAHTQVEQLPFLKGQDAHYYIMTDKDFKSARKLLE